MGLHRPRGGSTPPSSTTARREACAVRHRQQKGPTFGVTGSVKVSPTPPDSEEADHLPRRAEHHAGVAESVVAPGLGPGGALSPCRFDPCRPHQHATVAELVDVRDWGRATIPK